MWMQELQRKTVDMVPDMAVAIVVDLDPNMTVDVVLAMSVVHFAREDVISLVSKIYKEL